jgi:hypothetical protein
MDAPATVEPIITAHPMQKVWLQVGDDSAPPEMIDVVALGAFNHAPFIVHENRIVNADDVFDDYLLCVSTYPIAKFDG